jgi:hypothetical protein
MVWNVLIAGLRLPRAKTRQLMIPRLANVEKGMRMRVTMTLTRMMEIWEMMEAVWSCRKRLFEWFGSQEVSLGSICLVVSITFICF